LESGAIAANKLVEIMKRTILSLFLLTTVLLFTACGEAPKVAEVGDPAPPPDGDGNVTAADALYCLQMAVGSQTVDLTTCDVDDGGTATAADALESTSRVACVERFVAHLRSFRGVYWLTCSSVNGAPWSV